MAGVGRISIKETRELQAVVVAIKALDTDVRKEIRTRTRAIARTEWTNALAQNATSEQQRRLIVRTSRVNVTDQGVQVTAATLKRGGLTGGATPYDEGKSFEFGNSREKQLPPHRPAGYVFWPAAATMVPRLLALWAQTAVRTAMEALEGKR